MIPNEVFEIMHDQPMAGHLGTRDKKLATIETMIWGIKIHDDKQTITVYIPEKASAKQLSNLNDNKKVSVFISQPLSHQSYQFKGEFISNHPATDDDHKIVNNYVDCLYEKYFKLFGYPREIIEPFAFTPAVAITFRADDVFKQTPGPGAGTKIN
jgi:hypothetical protein